MDQLQTVKLRLNITQQHGYRHHTIVKMAAFHLCVSVLGPWYCACWHTYNKWNRATISVLSCTCAFPLTSPLFKRSVILTGGTESIYSAGCSMKLFHVAVVELNVVDIVKMCCFLFLKILCHIVGCSNSKHLFKKKNQHSTEQQL